MRAASGERRARWAAVAGAASALGLAIGIEALAFHALIGASFAIRLMADRKAVGEARAYGLALGLGCLAVFLVQCVLRRLQPTAFDRFERWLDRVESWADHDALTMFVLGPLLLEAPRRVSRLAAWAKAPGRWRRRAAAVTLIHGVRHGRFAREAARVARSLSGDGDDMVQKGLGWLLREWCKVNPDEAVPVVLSIRSETSRLVVRTACETLSPADRKRVLALPNP